jgi:hypothetical protein
MVVDMIEIVVKDSRLCSRTRIVLYRPKSVGDFIRDMGQIYGEEDYDFKI